MIGYFPSPFPDEMIYSVILRYHLASPNIRASYTKEELFLNKITDIRTDFFPYAVLLEERLKHFSFYSSKKIIKELTFYEYFVKFLSHDDINKLEDLLINKRAGHISSYIFNHQVENYNNKYLKFCIECYEEELIQNIPFWHITHNLPGVFICPKHKSVLVESNVLMNDKKLKELPSKKSSKPIPLIEERDLYILTQISSETIKLFKLENSYPNYLTSYILYLYNLKYIHTDLDENKLLLDFENFYSDRLCEILNVNKREVISRIINNIKNNYHENYHPLFHILFIIFCRKKIEDLSIQMLPTPFGLPPFKCRNIACKYCNKRSVEKINLNFRINVSGVYGTFNCQCGYRYMLNSVSSEELIVLNYGEVWWEYVISLLYDKDYSIEKVCKEQKVKGSLLYEILPTKLKNSNFKKYSVEQYRESFLSEYERNKETNILFEQDNLYKVRQWLRGCDYKWYDANE